MSLTLFVTCYLFVLLMEGTTLKRNNRYNTLLYKIDFIKREFEDNIHNIQNNKNIYTAKYINKDHHKVE
jgi:hypothetical protein